MLNDTQSADDRAWHAYEARVRREAARQGLALRKSRCRTPMAIDYGAYWLVDPALNTIVAGDPSYGGMDLDQVAAALKECA